MEDARTGYTDDGEELDTELPEVEDDAACTCPYDDWNDLLGEPDPACPVHGLDK